MHASARGVACDLVFDLLSRACENLFLCGLSCKFRRFACPALKTKPQTAWRAEFANLLLGAPRAGCERSRISLDTEGQILTSRHFMSLVELWIRLVCFLQSGRAVDNVWTMSTSLTAIFTKFGRSRSVLRRIRPTSCSACHLVERFRPIPGDIDQAWSDVNQSRRHSAQTCRLRHAGPEGTGHKLEPLVIRMPT